MTGSLKGLLSSALLSQPPDSWPSAGLLLLFFVFFFFLLCSVLLAQVTSKFPLEM